MIARDLSSIDRSLCRNEAVEVGGRLASSKLLSARFALLRQFGCGQEVQDLILIRVGKSWQ
jgi:hypothetical protein